MSKEVKKNGRPTKYLKEYDELVYKFALLGLTDVEMSKMFRIDDATFYRWKNEHPSFCEAIHAGKNISDSDVVASLYKSTQDRMIPTEQAFKTKSVYYNEDGKRVESEQVEVVTVMQAVPGNPQAQMLWIDRRLRKNPTWQKDAPIEKEEVKPTEFHLVLPKGSKLVDE